MIQELLYQRRYSLKLNKKERERYNALIGFLGEVIPCTHLKVYSPFSIKDYQPEIWALMGGIVGALSIGVLPYLTEGISIPNLQASMTFGSILGACLFVVPCFSISNKPNSFKSDINYIESSLRIHKS